MIARRHLALGAAVVLGILLVARISPRELAGRLRFLRASASREVAARRLGGSATAFDRRYFIFLESARRRLPGRPRGIALFVPNPSSPSLYLAAYDFAPVPVAMRPSVVPEGWIAAVYGAERPPGWAVAAEVPGGALLAPTRP